LHECEVLEHPPQNPDLTPSDFHLFGSPKEHMVGKQFATDGNRQNAVIFWLKVLDSNFFHTEIDALVS
jgi:hypothetical protein